ncbi:glycosyltransferase [Cetobacterium somerae]|uniref:glycosyltransferase n=1 Tax=Cetobacterium somerae TaxID=188913 RepID=UPI00248E63FF|nr:glycosyltransferase [Cetobacterium somerae]
MKILFYNGSLRMGGAEKILVEILNGLDKKDKEIDLLISDNVLDENFFEKELPKEIKLNYLISSDLIEKTKFYKSRKKNIFYKIMYNYYMRKEQKEKTINLAKVLKDKKYDVVVDFDMGLSKNIDLVDAKKRIAWIHSPIDSWYRKNDKIKRLGERLKKYNTLVTICDDMKEKTEKLYPFLKGKLVRIYNPFDIEKIQDQSKDLSEITEEKRVLLKDDYIISVGRLDNYSKDYYTLLKGFKGAKGRGLTEKLYILGEGEERRLIESWIDELDLKNDVILLGKYRNPYPWIKNAKLFVHSSRFEGLPTVLIEALICGVPVISSDCPTGPKEILLDGKIGKLYTIGDYKTLSDEICMLVKNRGKYEEYRKLSFKRAQDFRKEISNKLIEDVLQRGINDTNQ